MNSDSSRSGAPAGTGKQTRQSTTAATAQPANCSGSQLPDQLTCCGWCSRVGAACSISVRVPSSAHVSVQEAAVEVIADRVIDEPLGGLGLAPRLIPAAHTHTCVHAHMHTGCEAVRQDGSAYMQ